MLVAELDALGGKALADVLVEVEVHIPVIRALAPDAHHVLHGAALVVNEADEGGGIGQDPLVLGDGVGDGGLHVVGGALIGGGEGAVHAAQLLAAVVVDGGGGHIAVGDGDGHVVQGVQLGVEQADGLDKAGLAAHFHEVAGSEGLGDKQGQAGEQVGEDVLHGEGQCQADDADQGHQRAGVDAQGVGHDDGGDNPEHRLDGGGDEAPEGAVQLLGLVQSLGDHAGDDLDDDIADHQSQDRGENAGEGDLADFEFAQDLEEGLLRALGGGCRGGGYIAGEQVEHVYRSFTLEYMNMFCARCQCRLPR